METHQSVIVLSVLFVIVIIFQTIILDLNYNYIFDIIVRKLNRNLYSLATI